MQGDMRRWAVNRCRDCPSKRVPLLIEPLTFEGIREQLTVPFPELQSAYRRLADDYVFGHGGHPGQYTLIEELL